MKRMHMGILLIEDNPGDVRLVQEALKEIAYAPHDLLNADRLKSALQQLQDPEFRRKVDVILLDLSLPDSEGLESIAKLQAAAPDLPIVVLTGRNDDAVGLMAVQVGAQDFLVKGTATGEVIIRALRYAVERSRAEEIARLAEESERTQMFRERFVGILGHDLRSPLQTITLGARLLLETGDLDENQSKVVASIARSADRMGRMISDVLDFTRARLGGSYPLTKTRCNMSDICHKAIEELQLAHPQRTLIFEAEDQYWGECDADRIAQIVSNLVGNAIQHGDPEQIIRVRVRSEAHHVVLEVHNGGSPIPAASLPHLFDPFYVVRTDATKRTSTGLGLGLYITREIALAHGGDVDVSSTPDNGTRFSVRIPRHPEGPAAPIDGTTGVT